MSSKCGCASLLQAAHSQSMFALRAQSIRGNALAFFSTAGKSAAAAAPKRDLTSEIQAAIKEAQVRIFVSRFFVGFCFCLISVVICCDLLFHSLHLTLQ
jgi:hypothetical protein